MIPVAAGSGVPVLSPIRAPHTAVQAQVDAHCPIGVLDPRRVQRLCFFFRHHLQR
jgi:hypothetical protein